ncbi:hypothetical protein PAMP_006918 [Pampus punctatissimus]
MMTAHRDLSFPLVIVCLVFIRGYTPIHTTAEVVQTTTTDYDYNGNSYEDITFHQKTTPKEVTLQRCDYNACREGQPSCAELAASKGCLCPGFTLHNVIPLAPKLKTVSRNGSEVVVQWCAPYSHVTAYIVTVAEKENWKFKNNQRRGSVGDIKHIAVVCVVAVNDAGDSEKSCMMYYPKDNSSLPLKAGLIGGALGFLLLLLLAVLLWRHKRQRKQDANISMHDTTETP